MSPANDIRPSLDARMTLSEHLEELRVRVLRSVIALGVALVAAMVYQDTFLKVLLRPHELAMERLPPEKRLKVDIVTNTYPEAFFVMFKIALVAALVMASPVILYQLWRFVSAGLYARERRFVYLYGPISFLLFAFGVAFGYFYLIPITFQFLAEYGLDYAKMFLKLEEYVNLVAILTLILGLVFELPLVMLFVSKLGLISADAFARQRRLACVLLVVAAAVLTPTGDVFTLAMVSVPMYLLYEVGILLCRFAGGKPASPS